MLAEVRKSCRNFCGHMGIFNSSRRKPGAIHEIVHQSNSEGGGKFSLNALAKTLSRILFVANWPNVCSTFLFASAIMV